MSAAAARRRKQLAARQKQGGVDAVARVAIETLHRSTHDFAVATVHEVDALNERVDGVL